MLILSSCPLRYRGMAKASSAKVWLSLTSFTLNSAKKAPIGISNFCEKLKNTPDGDGTVLDHVLIYKGTNMGNSHRHAHEKIPVELVGGIDGNFKGNRHLVFPDNVQRNSNMLLSILDLYDIHLDNLGDSTGRLPGLS